jgi:hypothetical protein
LEGGQKKERIETEKVLWKKKKKEHITVTHTQAHQQQCPTHSTAHTGPRATVAVFFEDHFGWRPQQTTKIEKN